MKTLCDKIWFYNRVVEIPSRETVFLFSWLVLLKFSLEVLHLEHVVTVLSFSDILGHEVSCKSVVLTACL